MNIRQNMRAMNRPPVAPEEQGELFNIISTGIPYLVKAIPFSLDGDTRFYVRINGGPRHLFTWDGSVGRLRVLQEGTVVLPHSLELAISKKLLSHAV